MTRILLLGCVILTIGPIAAAENWPGWRGPRGDGSSLDPNVPINWDLDQDLVWKVRVPGIGHASPIIWGDHLFLVTAFEDTGERQLLCLDQGTGELNWSRTVLEAPAEGIHRLNSRASSTPVTDGENVYVSFLDETRMFVAAYDFEGNPIWTAHSGSFSSKHGYCSSPILWRDTVIVNGDHDGDGFIVAFNRADGSEVWKQPRPNHTRSYCTPIIREIEGRNQMILSGSKCVASYDPDSGKQHWIIDGPTEQYVASLVYNEELKLLFMTCGFPERHMMAIDPTQSGNVTESAVVWHETTGAAYVPSPIAVGPYFLVVADNGVASCFLAQTGERLWRERLIEQGPGGHSASLLSANGLVYFVSDSGQMTVVKPGKELEVVARNDLGEKMSASPIVYEGKLFLRGHEHLYCVGK